MKWETLIEETARRAGTDCAEVRRTLDFFFDALIEKMDTEDTIQLREDFGCFELREAGGLQAGRPQTVTKCRRTPVFKKSNQLKKRLRQTDQDYCAMLRDVGRDAQAQRLEQKLAGK